MFAVKLANFLIFTVFGENNVKCLEVFFFREKPIGSVIYMKSKLDRGLGNLWTSRSLIQWVILRGQMLF